MPTYCFRNNETGEVHEEIMKMDKQMKKEGAILQRYT